jgi:magnesium-transporting ATPase (P-type)
MRKLWSMLHQTWIWCLQIKTAAVLVSNCLTESDKRGSSFTLYRLSFTYLLDWVLSNNSTEICFNGSKFYYELLDVLEFTSDRKIMSIVVKESGSGKFLLLSKGADEAIFPRSCPGTWFSSIWSSFCHYAYVVLSFYAWNWIDSWMPLFFWFIECCEART